MTETEKHAWAVAQMQEMAAQTGRIPQKADFDPVTLSRIKAILGPWPRALEAAELKQKKTIHKKKHPRKTRAKQKGERA